MRPCPSRVTMAALAILGLAAPSWGQAVRTPATKPAAAPSSKIDLNTATAAELEELPGVGPARAESIIKARPYKAVEDLKAVKGISESTYEGLVGRVRVAPKEAAKPREKETAKEKEAAPTPGHKIDLNTATAAELEELPGVGPARAESIIKARPYKAVEDLKAVKGISAATYSGLADRVHVVQAPKPVAPKPAEPAIAKAETPTRPASTTPKETAKPKKATLAPGQKVNLNTATREELDELPGIGPVRAGQIIEARPFAAIEDIMKIKGIKEVEFGKIKDMITVK